MYYDILALRNFYDCELGRKTAITIQQLLNNKYPIAKGDRVVGLGYTTPWLKKLTQQKAASCLAFMPERQGAMAWPASNNNLTALVSEAELPLPDASVDYFLLVHFLEHTSNEAASLAEIWRVLAPGGRLIIVAPHRPSLWINREETPFGSGRPYSKKQLKKALTYANFSCHNWHEALYALPTKSRFTEYLLQKLRYIAPIFGGILILEARKDVYQPIGHTRIHNRKSRKLRPILISAKANYSTKSNKEEL